MASALTALVDQEIRALESEGKEPTVEEIEGRVNLRNQDARREAVHLGVALRARYRLRARNTRAQRHASKTPLARELEEFVQAHPEAQEEELQAWLQGRQKDEPETS